MKPVLISLLRLNCGITLCVLLWFLSCSRASAQLYAWTIDDIYSSADGSVQFIQLSTQPAPRGELLSGYSFSSSNPSGTKTGSYYSEVGEPSGGGYQFLLFATPAFSLLPGAIRPDHTMPSGFLFTPAGRLTVSTLSGGWTSSISYSDLPTDGIHALNANGNVVPAVAENFAGQIYVIPEPSTVILLFIGLTLFAFRFIKGFDVVIQK
jgi:hypothetical protein